MVINNKSIQVAFWVLGSIFIPAFSGAQTLGLFSNEKINPVLISDHWNAQWISHPSASLLDYGVFHFRKQLELNAQPGEFIIHISDDNRYRLFVNGNPVCFGPARGDLSHWFYESIDISPWLKAGSNTLAVVVWNFGEKKPWAQFSLKTALIIQGNSAAEEITNTGTTWKVIQNKSYAPAQISKEETDGQFIVVGPCDLVDAALYPWGWEQPLFDDSKWENATAIDIGHPRGVGTDINWVLTPRRIPLMEQNPQQLFSVRHSSGSVPPEGFLYGNKGWSVPANQKTIVLFDQGTLTTGYPELIVSGGKGGRIKITYAESLFDADGQKGNRDVIEGKSIKGYFDIFLPDGGANRLFRPLWFRTWRYLQIEIETKNEPITIESLNSEFVAYPLIEKARFHSNQPLLDQVWKVGWRTARLCANETYFDCPYYEQLQYVGDTRIQALISLYVSGDDRLMRNALLQYDESRIHEGLTQSRYPSSSPQFIPPFSLYWVDMVHDYWMLRDDPGFVKQFLPGITGVLNWFTERFDQETGLLGKLEYWNFVDWAKEWPWDNQKRIGGIPAGAGVDGNSSIITMQFAYAAYRAAELFASFGHLSEAEKYNQLANRMTNAVYAKCWDEKRGYLADTPEKKQFSMHAQIFGVLTNTIPQSQQRSFTEKFINDKSLIQPTMYFRFYLTQALYKTGLADRYIETLGLWEEMLKNGLTTFAENPDPARSDCHAWSASPNYDFLATVAGIRPLSSGFKTVLIEPALGPLTYIEGQMPHPLGTIFFDLKRKSDNGFVGFIELPEGLTGIFRWGSKEVALKNKTEINL
jgi:hypothetical protein